MSQPPAVFFLSQDHLLGRGGAASSSIFFRPAKRKALLIPPLESNQQATVLRSRQLAAGAESSERTEG
jgi:hypothetical protein